MTLPILASSIFVCQKENIHRKYKEARVNHGVEDMAMAKRNGWKRGKGYMKKDRLAHEFPLAAVI